MDINGLGDVFNKYGDMYSDKSDTGSKIKNTLENTDYSKSTDEELLNACKQFESYFTEQVFKALQKMVPESEESKNEYMQQFGDKLIEEYASSATNQGDGLGIAQMLFEQMKRNYGINTIPSETEE